MTPQTLRREHPDLFLLDPSDVEGAGAYLARHGLLGPEEVVTQLERAGEGNMNCTLRAFTPSRTLIVKQSRPWVEKYPQFEAPWDRAVVEAEFYRIVSDHPRVAAFLPNLHFADPESRVLVIEDLGEGGDYTGIYLHGEILTADTLLRLAEFLSGLHGAYPPGTAHPPLPNSEMRALNHAHVFDIPLRRDNGLNLDALAPGLRSAADPLLAPSKFHDEVTRLGREIYLADGPTLVHGDFFPGSILRTASGPRVIDPEFCHFGRAELDVGV
ncbi:MAG: phosphotransferase, partial [Limisphaerales bacterium]